MVWEAGAPNAGFSPAKPWLPVPAEHLERAVDVEEAAADSTLSEYRRLIRFRRAHPALRQGAIAFLDAPGDVLAFTRHSEDEQVLCLFNLSTTETVFHLPAGMSVAALTGHGFSGTLRASGRDVELSPGDGFFGQIA
jgi:alpha-glucosidase